MNSVLIYSRIAAHICHCGFGWNRTVESCIPTWGTISGAGLGIAVPDGSAPQPTSLRANALRARRPDSVCAPSRHPMDGPPRVHSVVVCALEISSGPPMESQCNVLMQGRLAFKVRACMVVEVTAQLH